jgi:hypothetical protein
MMTAAARFLIFRRENIDKNYFKKDLVGVKT